MDTVRKQFRERVRGLRLVRGLSQGWRSRRVFIGLILAGLRGERNPTLKNIVAIAQALDITLSELFLLGAYSESEKDN